MEIFAYVVLCSFGASILGYFACRLIMVMTSGWGGVVALATFFYVWIACASVLAIWLVSTKIP